MTGAPTLPLVRQGNRVTEAPIVSVVILVLSDSGLALRCLDSLPGTAPTREVETIVVANGMLPEARAPLEEREDIVLLRCGTNLGFAGGNNLAATVARGEYLLLLNDDSVVEHGSLDHLLATARQDPAIGAVAGRILSADGSLQEAGSVVWQDGSTEHVGFGLTTDTVAYAYQRDVDYASANGLLIRRSAWDAVGGLDERYFPAYYEDVDLCMALHRHGYRIVYQPRSRLHHLESQSSSKPYRAFLLRRNRQRFVEKWGTELMRFDPPPAEVDAGSIEQAVQRRRAPSPPLSDLGTGNLDP